MGRWRGEGEATQAAGRVHSVTPVNLGIAPQQKSVGGTPSPARPLPAFRQPVRTL